MTQVHTTLQSAYLAGPMRGFAEYNFPAFRAAAKYLRGHGWTIYSPAERDEADVEALESHAKHRQTDEWGTALPLAYYMQFDLAAVARCDALILLEGWERSQGARLESLVAVELRKPVFELTEDEGLKHVNPAYVSLQFLENTVTLQDEGSYSVRAENVRTTPEFDVAEWYNTTDPVTGDDPGDETDPIPWIYREKEVNEDLAAMGISPEPRRHRNSARFHEHLQSLGALHDEKQRGYGTAEDPFANVRGSEKWGIPGWLGAMVRANDKIVRLQSFAQKGSLPFESVEDAFKDLAVYAIIALCLFEEEQKGDS